MAATTQITGQCLAPFLESAAFTLNGFVPGRLCANLTGTECCLPCPQTDFLYPDNFNTITTAASWLNVVALICSGFLLVSFATLSVDKTHRHYLSICLVVGTTLMNLAFIVPLAARPDVCYDAITPNSMKSDKTCAVSGSLLLIGGWVSLMWVFLRALAVHLQICWQLVMGKYFMYTAFFAGWAIPVAMGAGALSFTGVSYRFGTTCHINHANGVAIFWIPLLTITGLTMIIQAATFGYCVKVYLAQMNDNGATTNSSGLASQNGTMGTSLSPRQRYRRVRRVMQLQWRGLTIVLIIIVDLTIFAVIFITMDNSQTSATTDPAKALLWTFCLITNPDNKNACLSLTKDLVVNEATVMAVLVLLSINGIWLLLLLGRWDMVTGWKDIFSSLFYRIEPDFTSADVHALTKSSKSNKSYELLSASKSDTLNKETMLPAVSPISPLTTAMTREGRQTPDYFGREARYQKPSQSFSTPNISASVSPERGHDRQESANGARWQEPMANVYSPLNSLPTVNRQQNGYFIDPLRQNKVQGTR